MIVETTTRTPSRGTGFLFGILRPWMYLLKFTGFFPVTLSQSTFTRPTQLLVHFLNYSWSGFYLGVQLTYLALYELPKSIKKIGLTTNPAKDIMSAANSLQATVLSIICIMSFMWVAKVIVRHIHTLDQIFRPYLIQIDKRAVGVAVTILSALIVGVIALESAVLHNSINAENVFEFASNLTTKFETMSYGGSMALAWFLNTIWTFNYVACYIWQFCLMVVCYAVARCFIRITTRLEKSLAFDENETKHKTMEVKVCLEDHAKLSRLMLKLDDAVSTTTFAFYMTDVVWILYQINLLGERLMKKEEGSTASTTSTVLMDLAFKFFFMCLRTIMFINLHDKATMAAEIVQEGLEMESDELTKSSLLFHLIRIKTTPAGITLAGIIMINREFVASMAGLLITYVLVFWGFGDKDSDSVGTLRAQLDIMQAMLQNISDALHANAQAFNSSS